MSEKQDSILQPFVPTTTRNIERANRLLSVKDHPGFIEILTIAQEIARSADEILVDYGGWDLQQIAILKARAQAAKEGYQLLIAKIQEYIKIGIEEARALESQFEAKTPQQIIEQGDHVRQKVLERFGELDTARETRAPGSF